jgi:hypothetical protein
MGIAALGHGNGGIVGLADKRLYHRRWMRLSGDGVITRCRRDIRPKNTHFVWRLPPNNLRCNRYTHDLILGHSRRPYVPEFNSHKLHAIFFSPGTGIFLFQFVLTRPEPAPKTHDNPSPLLSRDKPVRVFLSARLEPACGQH